MQQTTDSGMANIIHRFERVTVTALQVLTIFMVLAATVALYALFIRHLVAEPLHIDSVPELLPVMQRAFAGILTVVIGLELLETLRTYFTHHHVRLEVILVVAILAVGRHVIQVDFEHTTGGLLAGMAALVAALMGGYVVLRRNIARGTLGELPEEEDSPTPGQRPE